MPQPASLDEQITNIVSAAERQGLDAIVAEMPNGQVRVFVDAASKFYKQKFTTILPERFKKVGTKYIAQYKAKPVAKKDLPALQEKAKTNKVVALRLFQKNGKYFWKTGKAKTMTRKDFKALEMQMRREAGYEPLHHRPGTRPQIGRILKQNAARGYGKQYEDKK